MRIALLSDTHTDFAALQAVEEHARNQGVQAYWSLGDLVGYGADPALCLRWGQDNLTRWINGNHEDMLKIVINCIGHEGYTLEGRTFRQVYRSICQQWSSDKLAAKIELDRLAKAISAEYHKQSLVNGARPEVFESLLLNCVMYPGADLLDEAALKQAGKENWILFLEQVRSAEKEPPQIFDQDGLRMILSHGSPPDGLTEYLCPWNNLPTRSYRDERRWEKLWSYLQEQAPGKLPLVMIMGHTHMPLYARFDTDQYNQDADLSCMVYGQPLPLGAWATLINPGSAGHQADLDTRTAYALLDTTARQVTYFRVKYNRRGKARDLAQTYASELLRQEYSQAVARIEEEPDTPAGAAKLLILQQRLEQG